MANEVRIAVIADDKASGTFRQVKGEAEGLGGTMSQVGKITAGVLAADALKAGASAIAGQMGDVITKFNEANAVSAQLDQVLKSTGGAAGVTRDQLDALASSLQKQTTFDDDAIQGAQALLLTFTSIGKDVFPDATKTVLDMSQALGQDLKSSSIQLGKALNDPIQGVTALRRVGVSFTEQQLEQIKTMQESGDIMGAQRLILDELSKEFGGSAAAAADTFGGHMKQLQNDIDNTKEAIGGRLIGVFQELPRPLQEATVLLGQFGPQLGQLAFGFAAIGPAVAGIGPAIAGMAAVALPAITSLGAALLLPPLGFVTALVAAGVAAYIFRDQIAGAFTAVKTAVLDGVSAVVDFLKKNWPEVATLISGPFLPLVALATDAFGIRSALLGALKAILDALGGLASQAADRLGGMVDAVAGAVKGAVNGVIDAINYLIRAWNSLHFSLGAQKIAGETVFPGISIDTPDLPQVPRLQRGVDFLPADTLAFLHKGEAVVPADENRRRRLYGGQGLTVNIQGPVNVNNVGGQQDATRAISTLGYLIFQESLSRGLRLA